MSIFEPDKRLEILKEIMTVLVDEDIYGVPLLNPGWYMRFRMMFHSVAAYRRICTSKRSKIIKIKMLISIRSKLILIITGFTVACSVLLRIFS